MKTLLLVVGVVLGLSGLSEAAERESVQKAFGGISTVDRVVSSSAQVITGIAWDCGATACNVGVYDDDDLDTAVADGVFEGGSAANTSNYVAIDPPIRTTTGVTVIADANVDGVIVFTEQATP